MSYAERYQAATFRGIPFSVEASEEEFSKRIVLHTFPGSDDHASEDLGRGPPLFSFTAHIVGYDYDLQVDQLIDACMASGPGELVHPYYGRQMVHCQRCSPRRTLEEQGKASLSLTFVLAGIESFPTVQQRASGSVLSAADSLKAFAVEKFKRVYDFLGATADEVTEARVYLSEEFRAIGDVSKFAESVFKVSAGVALEIGQLSNDLQYAISAPARVAEILGSATSLVRGAGGGLLSNLHELSNLSSRAGSKIEGSILGKNALAGAAAELFKKLSISQRANLLAAYIAAVKANISDPLAAPTLETISEESWRKAMEAAVDEIKAQLITTQDFEEYEVLSNLGESLLLISESSDVFALPNLRRYRLPYDMPLLLAAFKIYGNLDRAKEIQIMNDISDPIFIAAGTTLEYFEYE